MRFIKKNNQYINIDQISSFVEKNNEASVNGKIHSTEIKTEINMTSGKKIILKNVKGEEIFSALNDFQTVRVYNLDEKD